MTSLCVQAARIFVRASIAQSPDNCQYLFAKNHAVLDASKRIASHAMLVFLLWNILRKKLFALSANDSISWYTISMEKKTKTPERKLNKKMLERIIIVHNAIKSGMYPNVRKLQRLYCEQTGYSNVGEATIYRTLDALSVNFHAPLKFDRAKGGYCYMDDNWEFALNSVSEQEIFYLSAAKTLLASFEGSPVYNAIAEAINFITDTQEIGKSELLKRIAVPPVPKISVDENIWKEMLCALQNNLIVEFDYNGRWNTQTTHRRVHPYQFLFDDGACFLFGYAEERKADRLFYLTRIKNLTLTDEHFELPENFEFSSRCGGGKFGAFMTDELVSFTIDLYGDARQIVKDRIWADDQKIIDFDDEEKTRIEFSSTQWFKVMEWVLSQGEHAVPVAPKEFVSEWKERVEAMAETARGL